MYDLKRHHNIAGNRTQCFVSLNATVTFQFVHIILSSCPPRAYARDLQGGRREKTAHGQISTRLFLTDISRHPFLDFPNFDQTFLDQTFLDWDISWQTFLDQVGHFSTGTFLDWDISGPGFSKCDFSIVSGYLMLGEMWRMHNESDFFIVSGSQWPNGRGDVQNAWRVRLFYCLWLPVT